MKKKTIQLNQFLNELHEFIINSHTFRKDVHGKSEIQIQTEIRPIIINYLEKYFRKKKYIDFKGKANKSFYWEGQEGKFGKSREKTFAARNYPDFIITEPYLIGIEYKKSLSGSLIKQGIGQSLMHTMSKDFNFVYFLFQDENKDKKIAKSILNKKEKRIIEKVWNDFNVFVKIV